MGFSGNTFAADEEHADALDGEQRDNGRHRLLPGVVRGRAVVVRDPRGVELPAGSILVAERTDPGWIMLFPAAAGLVVERGSLLSHSAIVARELGLPCAVSVPQATTWIKAGILLSWMEARDSSAALLRTAMTEVASHADFSAIRYAQCWEDADILCEDYGFGQVMSVCPLPAGDNSLALLTADPAGHCR